MLRQKKKESRTALAVGYRNGNSVKNDGCKKLWKTLKMIKKGLKTMAVKSYENIKKQPYLKKHPYIKKDIKRYKKL